MNQTLKPVFLIGAPRSGTTIIFEVLSVHPDLGWFNNHLSSCPKWPVMAATSRICDTPRVGIYLKGRKEKARKFVPLSSRWMLPGRMANVPRLIAIVENPESDLPADATPTLETLKHFDITLKHSRRA